MGVALSIIGIAIGMALLTISVIKQRQEKQAKAEALGDRHSAESVAQREHSMERRAAVREAHAESIRVGAQADASDPDA